LQLFRRIERELVWSGVKETEGRDWLKKSFSRINLGNAPNVSGAAEDANLRAREAFESIRVALNNFATDDKYVSCQSFLVALSESLETWLDSFLVAARTVASESCRPILSQAGDVWTRCEGDYRQGFKNYVRAHLRKWFEEQSPRSMYAAIEEATQKAWTKNFIEPLERALGTALPKNDLLSEFRESV
jgi:hypothetical protein